MTTQESIDCSICRNTIGKDHVKLKCGHKFDHQCIKTAFCVYQTDKCPMCRRVFSYQPSLRQRSMARLKKLMWKRYSNSNKVMQRNDVVSLNDWFKQHKVNIPFLNRIQSALMHNHEYEYVFYTKGYITMFKNIIPKDDEAKCYMPNAKICDADECTNNIPLHPDAYFQRLADEYNLDINHMMMIQREFLDFDFEDDIMLYANNIREEHRHQYIHDRLLYYQAEHHIDWFGANDETVDRIEREVEHLSRMFP